MTDTREEQAERIEALIDATAAPIGPSFWFVTWGEATVELHTGTPRPTTWRHRVKWRIRGWRYAVTDAIDDGRYWLARKVEQLAERIRP